IVRNIRQLEFFLLTHEGAFLFIPRTLSGVFGTLSIIVIYKIAKVTFPKNSRIHFWSTLLFTFSLNHIQLSHLGKPWVPALFFYLLAIFFLIKSNVEKRFQ